MMGTSYSQKSDTTYHNNLDYIHTGNYTSEVQGEELYVKFSNSEAQKDFKFSSKIPMSRVSVNQGNDPGNSYTIPGDAGVLSLHSDGTYQFEESNEMRSLLKSKGLKKTPPGMYLMMTLGALDKASIELLRKEDFALNVNDLVAVASSQMDLSVLQSKIALLNTLESKERTLKTLVMMENLHIDKNTIDTMSKHTTVEEARDLNKIAQWVSMKIDEDFLSMLSGAGYAQPSFKDIMSAKSHKIDANYITEIKEQGYSDLTLKNIVTLKSMQITGPWIAKVNAKNGSKLPISKLINLKTSSN
ncbi:MAG: hypothetical protein AAF466_01770 [Bacteroidota bacterium]